MIKRCIKNANGHVKRSAHRTAHKGHHPKKSHGKKHSHHAKKSHRKKHSHHAKKSHGKKHSHHGKKKLVQVANKAAASTTAKAAKVKMANVLAKMQA